MIGLLKAFGKGILYVIGAPFFVVALVLFGAIGLLAFIFQIFKSIIFFFTGQKFFPELPEDKELRLKREAAAAREEPVQEDTSSNIISPIFEEEIPVPEPEPSPIFVQRNEPEPTIEETVFEDTSSLEDMKSMFYDCNSLINLDLTGFDTSIVTNMSFVFYGC